MSKSANVVSMDPHSDYPLSNTEATRMLAAGFEKASEEKGLSQRTIAKTLGYKTSVVLSHMALGRVPIPIDRAMDFARILNLDQSKFLLAVLEQRHPDIDFLRVLGKTAKSKATATNGRESYMLEELESLAGTQLDEVSVDTANILREVVSDKNPKARWLSLQEMPMMEELRKKYPNGMAVGDRKKLVEALESL